MIWNPAKLVAFLVCVLFWILIVFFMISCANVDKVQGKEGWFPVGMDEDSQDFYNTKYNMMDTSDGSRGNSDMKIFKQKF